MKLTLPSPDAPLYDRMVAALILLALMPVLWPVLTVAFICVWVAMGVVIILMSVLVLALPVMALLGVKEKRTKTFEVEIDEDRVLEFQEAVAPTGARVEEK